MSVSRDCQQRMGMWAEMTRVGFAANLTPPFLDFLPLAGPAFGLVGSSVLSAARRAGRSGIDVLLWVGVDILKAGTEPIW